MLPAFLASMLSPRTPGKPVNAKWTSRGALRSWVQQLIDRRDRNGLPTLSMNEVRATSRRASWPCSYALSRSCKSMWTPSGARACMDRWPGIRLARSIMRRRSVGRRSALALCSIADDRRSILPEPHDGARHSLPPLVTHSRCSSAASNE